MSNLKGISKNLVEFAGNTLISSLMLENWVCGALLGSARLPGYSLPEVGGLLISATMRHKGHRARGSDTSISSPTRFLYNTLVLSLLPDCFIETCPLKVTNDIFIANSNGLFFHPVLIIPRSLLFIKVISVTADTNGLLLKLSPASMTLHYCDFPPTHG